MKRSRIARRPAPLLTLLLLTGCLAPPPPEEPAPPAPPPAPETVDLRGGAKRVRSLALRYVERHRRPDGSYGVGEAPQRTAVTAFVLYVLSVNQRRYRPLDGPFYSEALTWLRGRQTEDGRFGAGGASGPATYFAAEVLRLLAKPRDARRRAAAEAWLADNPPVLPAALQTVLAAHRQVRHDPDEGLPLPRATLLLADLQSRQVRRDDQSPDYGRVQPPPETTGWLLDPVAATALAALEADLVKRSAAP
jgi:hypothetical protein